MAADKDLAEELYDLMTEPRGATSEAIAARPTLMSLAFIRAEAQGDRDIAPAEERVAETARQVLKRFSDFLDEPLSEREPVDVDYGMAVRIYLALEQGTAGLLLKDRRKRAAPYTGRRVRTNSKAHPRRPSYEQRLLAALASGLWEREVAFLREHARAYLPQRPGRMQAAWARPYADLHLIWDLLGSVEAGIQGPLFAFGKGGMTDESAVELIQLGVAAYALFCSMLERSPRWDADKPPKGLRRAHTDIWMMRESSPFDSKDHYRLADAAQATSDLKQLVAQLDHAVETRRLFGVWRRWLLSCKCGGAQERGCSVHLFLGWCASYRSEVEQEWTALAGGFQSPLAFGRQVSDLSALWWRLGLNQR